MLLNTGSGQGSQRKWSVWVAMVTGLTSQQGIVGRRNCSVGGKGGLELPHPLCGCVGYIDSRDRISHAIHIAK